MFPSNVTVEGIKVLGHSCVWVTGKEGLMDISGRVWHARCKE